MMAANIAPGMERAFLSEGWENLIPKRYWQEVREEAADLVERDIKTDIQGYDIDGEIVRAAGRMQSGLE